MRPALADLHPLDRTIHLEPLGSGQFHGRVGTDYWNMGGPFGGATAATLLNAVMLHPDRAAPPVALTVNFCAALVEGDCVIDARLVRSGRSTQHWSLELRQEGVGVAATATVVTGAHREVWSHQPARPPSVAAPEALPRLDTRGRGAWLQNFEFRIAQNPPRAPDAAELQSTRSAVWVRDAPERPIDVLGLACLADTPFVRPFQVRGTLVPMGTVSLTTYFFASEAQLRAQGSQPILAVGDARVFRHGFNDQVVELWSAAGELLAAGGQVVWFKE